MKIICFYFCKVGTVFKSKSIIEDNLNNFSDKIDDQEKEKIIKNMWKNYGMTFIEYIYLDFFKKNNSHVKIEGIDNLNKVLNRDKPVIFVSGHFANYELMTMEITKKNIKLLSLVLSICTGQIDKLYFIAS